MQKIDRVEPKFTLKNEFTRDIKKDYKYNYTF